MEPYKMLQLCVIKEYIRSQKHLNRKQAGSWFGVGMAANENN